MKTRTPLRKDDKSKLESSLKHRSKYWQAIRVGRAAASIKIFVIYEGCSGLARANEMRRRLVERFEGKIVIETSAWNFALLRSAQLQEQAALQATEADIIVVSPGADNELPTHVKNWLETWMPEDRSQVASLAPVKIFGKSAQTMFRECVGQVPQPAGLDIFWNQRQSQMLVNADVKDEPVICPNE